MLSHLRLLILQALILNSKAFLRAPIPAHAPPRLGLMAKLSSGPRQEDKRRYLAISPNLVAEQIGLLRAKRTKSRDPAALTSGQAIRGLYDAFNARNATQAASFLDDDCIYEDLLLGPNTICRGKDAFTSVLKFHPAFVTSAIFSQLPFASGLPALNLVVDSIAEGDDTVGVEWHVEVGTTAFPLGRGLSQAKINPVTGKIIRVVDIAEAPWRVIGLLLAPLASVLLVFSELSIFKK